jgi:hypothetical protein
VVFYYEGFHSGLLRLLGSFQRIHPAFESIGTGMEMHIYGS